jgi:hypothetical protein
MNEARAKNTGKFWKIPKNKSLITCITTPLTGTLTCEEIGSGRR